MKESGRENAEDAEDGRERDGGGVPNAERCSRCGGEVLKVHLRDYFGLKVVEIDPTPLRYISLDQRRHALHLTGKVREGYLLHSVRCPESS
jgi:hypothetical protein